MTPPEVRVLRAEHVGTGELVAHLPPQQLPEIALAGRSNVGKSSLLNALAGARSLARVSRTPGKTRLLQLYLFELEVTGDPQRQGGSGQRLPLSVCDLPGYGYAKVSKSERAKWGPMVQLYLNGRPNLRGLLAILDIRRGITAGDETLLEMAAAMSLPVVVAANKLDKIPSSRRKLVVDGLRREMKGRAESVVGCSAMQRIGLQKLWRALVRVALPALWLLAAVVVTGIPEAAQAAKPAKKKVEAAPEVVVDRIVRKVGDELITYSDLEIEARLILLQESSLDETVGDIRPLILPLTRDEMRLYLERVTDRRLIWIDAVRHKRDEVPPEEVDAELLAMLKLELHEADWAELEVRWGATLLVLKEIAKRAVVIARYVRERVDSKATVTPEEILAAYEANRRLYPDSFEEHREQVAADLLFTRIHKLRKAWLLELRKRHTVTDISPP